MTRPCTKQVRKQKQIEHAAHDSDKAKHVKLADKIANLQDVAERPHRTGLWIGDESALIGVSRSSSRSGAYIQG
jgi:hypothetical protein